jgi:hypothetical protein
MIISVATLAGSRVGEVESRVRQAVASGRREIVIRLDDRDADADTLTFLRDVSVALRHCGGRLVVITDDAFVRRLLELTLLDCTFEVRDGLSTAMSGVPA